MSLWLLLPGVGVFASIEFIRLVGGALTDEEEPFDLKTTLGIPAECKSVPTDAGRGLLPEAAELAWMLGFILSQKIQVACEGSPLRATQTESSGEFDESCFYEHCTVLAQLKFFTEQDTSA